MSVFEELIDELKDEDLLEETVFSIKRSPQLEASHGVSSTASQDLTEPNGFASLGPQDDQDDFTAEPVDETETYRRRAMEEVSSLQLVEHVLSGIEREHMKMSPQVFDDLEVKKALHKFSQIGAPVGSPEHIEAEVQLYQECAKWHSALSTRDNNISVANVRRFCENSRPVLSSQALMSLARFYRNSPYNEAVRGKFDFVMTKLFSTEVDDSKRKLLFARNEALGHISTLYSTWASLSLSSRSNAQPEGSAVDAIVGFESFVREVESVDTFDELVSGDFFNRVRLLKENTAELFYEPAVLAAAMECNVRIGNRFVDLINQERVSLGDSTVEEKYGYAHDTVISGAASKTLLLLDVVRQSQEADAAEEAARVREEKSTTREVKFERAPIDESRRGLFAVNKWLLVATVLILALSAGVYFWSESSTANDSGIEVAPAVDLAGSELAQHIREASTSSDTLYGVMNPTWDALTEDDQKQFLSKAYDFAKGKGMRKVNLLNERGKTVGYAAQEKMEVFGPQ